MNATRAQDLTDRFPASFEEFRDLWAAEETREGLIGLMQRVILRLLNTLVVMLADSRAGLRRASRPDSIVTGEGPVCEKAVSRRACYCVFFVTV